MVAKGQWSDYENGKKKEYGEFVRKAREFVHAREAPWEANPADRGQPAKNDPRALVICLFLKIWLGRPYRDLVSFLSESTYLWPIIGPRASPSRKTQGARWASFAASIADSHGPGESTEERLRAPCCFSVARHAQTITRPSLIIQPCLRSSSGMVSVFPPSSQKVKNRNC